MQQLSLHKMVRKHDKYNATITFVHAIVVEDVIPS